MKNSAQYDIIEHSINSNICISTLKNPANKGSCYTIEGVDGVWEYSSYDEKHHTATFQNVDTLKYHTIWLN